jgi:HD-GYP domain-containing protein (c-di-GMP phosphodiesterase class II)
MLLRPAQLDDALQGQPLPWDLYTSAGVLVLSAGSDVTDPAQWRALRERALYRRADYSGGGGHPGLAIQEIISDLDTLFQTDEVGDLGASLRLAARALIALHKADADATIGLTRLLATPSRATRHCVLSVLICLSVGEHMEMTDTELETLAAATLSMNIGSMKLHAELVGRNQLDPHEKEAIREHPGQAVNLLYMRGVTDSDWLDAVFQHHENMDGSGYPSGLHANEICLPARIIRVADLYCAKIAGRFYRPPRSSLFAMQYLFGQERRKIDTQVASLLLRRYGFFPPGTLVTLANHETAVVTRVQERKQALRHVVSVLDGRQRPLDPPAERDTQKPGYAVARLSEPATDWPDIHWETAWGYV